MVILAMPALNKLSIKLSVSNKILKTLAMHSCNYEKEVSRVRTLGNDIVHSANTSTLELLKAIDSTVDTLVSLQRIYQEFEKATRQAVDSIKACKPTKTIDENNALCDVLSHGEGALQVQHEILNKGMASALRDPQLRGENREAVVQEYKRSVTACADLHNAIVELRWAIMEHDADLSPVSKSYSDVEELIKDLRA